MNDLGRKVILVGGLLILPRISIGEWAWVKVAGAKPFDAIPSWRVTAEQRRIMKVHQADAPLVEFKNIPVKSGLFQLRAAVGPLEGVPSLVVSDLEGYVDILQWRQDHWNFRRVKAGVSNSHSIVIADGRNDGVYRLYVDDADSHSIIELTPRGDEWDRNTIALPRMYSEAMVARESRVDHAMHLFVERATSKAHRVDHVLTFFDVDLEIFDCLYTKNAWRCHSIGSLERNSVGGTFAVNPPGDESGDVIVTASKVFVRHGYAWEDKPIGKQCLIRANIIASLDKYNTVFADGEYEFVDNYDRCVYRNIGRVNAVDVTPAKTHNDGIERVYTGQSEFTPTETGWKMEAGPPNFESMSMFAADLRGEGVDRLYGFGIANGMVIWEGTYFPAHSIVALSGFDVDPAAGLGSDAPAFLADALRTSLSQYGQFQMIDGDAMDSIIKERKFQSENCSSPGCAAALGSILKADVVLRGRVKAEKDGYTLTVTAVLVGSGESVLTRTITGVTADSLVESISRLAGDVAENWPRTLSGEKARPTSDQTLSILPLWDATSGEPTNRKWPTLVGEHISDEIEARLKYQQRLKTVDREKLRSVLERTGIRRTDAVGFEQLMSLSKQLGASIVVFGNISRSFGEYVLKLQTFHAKAGVLSAPVIRRGACGGDLDSLAKGIADDVGVSLAQDDSAAARGETGGWLGISTQALDDALQKSLGLSGSEGLFVQFVYPGSPAARAGLRRGFLVQRVAGKPVSSPDDLRRELSQLRPGSRVKLRISADRDVRDISVRLGTFPDAGTIEGNAYPRNALDSRPKSLRWHGAEFVERSSGVCVSSATAAMNALFWPRDAVEGVDKKNIWNLDDLRRALAKVDPKKGITFRVLREGEPWAIHLVVEQPSNIVQIDSIQAAW